MTLLGNKLIEDPHFIDVKTVLDNTMKESAEINIGMTKKQAEVIAYEYENLLWVGGRYPREIKGNSPFLLRINLALRAGDEYYELESVCLYGDCFMYFQPRISFQPRLFLYWKS